MFVYCPICSSQSISFAEAKKWRCEDCEFEYYHNVAGAVAVLLRKNDKILFTIRNQEPKKGKLDLPGGFIDAEESAEESCVREINEELSLTLNKQDLNYITSQPNTYLYKNVLYHTIDLFYTIEISQEINWIEKSEIQSIIWYSLDEIPWEKLAFESQKTVLQELANLD